MDLNVKTPRSFKESAYPLTTLVVTMAKPAFSHQRVAFLRQCCIVVFGFALTVFITLPLLRNDWTEYRHDDKEQVCIDTIAVNHWYGIHHHIAFFTAVLLFLIAAASLWVKNIPFRLAFVLMPVGVYPICFVAAFTQNLAPWTVYGGVEEENGASYFFLESGFLQGQTLALARLEEAGLVVSRFKVLVTTNGDSPRSYLLIIRPAAAPDEYGQLYLTPGGLLAGVRYDNKLYLAYDLKGQRAFGRGEIEQLSPFLCLDKDTLPNQDDAQRVSASGIGEKVGQARRFRIDEAMHHENDWVRAFAQKLLQIP